MTQSARVGSIDALKDFRVAMAKFAEASTVALDDAESEMQRTLVWLETEQHQHWQNELRKRTDAVGKAKEALRMKEIFKNATGTRDSAVDERKMLKIAIARMEEAEQK